ncbi:hypothetical protein NKH18_27005 [Streptomyces sp. M10(2022)]
MAGNAAVSRLVAQRYTAPVKPAPRSPRLPQHEGGRGCEKTRMAAHPPAASESKASQDAAVAPRTTRKPRARRPTRRR